MLVSITVGAVIAHVLETDDTELLEATYSYMYHFMANPMADVPLEELEKSIMEYYEGDPPDDIGEFLDNIENFEPVQDDELIRDL